MGAPRADQIELETLRIVLEDEHEGFFFHLVDLRTRLQHVLGYPPINGEVIEALLALQDGQHIKLRRRDQNQGYRIYGSKDDRSFFYGALLHAKIDRHARRRLEELSDGNDRTGIFVSHISEEHEIAKRLKELLEESFESPSIFVSPDSIRSGQVWYQELLQALRRSGVIISILTPKSLDNRWINFEAGVGIGAGATVVPLTARGLEKASIGDPMRQHQKCSLHIAKEVEELLRRCGAQCRMPLRSVDLEKFIREVHAAETAIPASDLDAKVLRSDGGIDLMIQNKGTHPLRMREARLLVASSLVGMNRGTILESFPPARYKIDREDGFSGHVLYPKSSDSLPWEALPEELTNTMGERKLRALSVRLPHNLREEEEELLVRYEVLANAVRIGPVDIRLKDIPTRTPA